MPSGRWCGKVVEKRWPVQEGQVQAGLIILNPGLQSAAATSAAAGHDNADSAPAGIFFGGHDVISATATGLHRFIKGGKPSATRLAIKGSVPVLTVMWPNPGGINTLSPQGRYRPHSATVPAWPRVFAVLQSGTRAKVHKPPGSGPAAEGVIMANGLVVFRPIRPGTNGDIKAQTRALQQTRI